MMILPVWSFLFAATSEEDKKAKIKTFVSYFLLIDEAI